MTKKYTSESCREFVLNHRVEIQDLMDSGKSLLDIFNYYKSIYETKWNDYPTFGSYIRKAGLRFNDAALSAIKTNRYAKKSLTMIAKTPEEKAEIYKKYKASMDRIPSDVKQAYIKKRQLTKSKYSKSQQQHRIDQMNETKRKHSSFNTSKIQYDLKSELINHFGESDIEVEYTDARYPFNCDFYIKSRDLFIELNGHWTHGEHPFDRSNEADMSKLKFLESKPQTYISTTSGKMKTSSYSISIKVWTQSDIIKFNTAVNNRLNYIAIYLSGCIYNQYNQVMYKCVDKYNTSEIVEFIEQFTSNTEELNETV